MELGSREWWEGYTDEGEAVRVLVEGVRRLRGCFDLRSKENHLEEYAAVKS